MNQDTIQPVRLTTVDPSRADQKPEMVKPSKKEATSPSRAALMTSRKSPSVRTVIGRGEEHDQQAHQGIHNPEQERRPDQRPAVLNLNAGNEG